MQEELEQHLSRGFRILYIDEVMVTKSTVPTHEWSKKLDNIKIGYNQFQNTTLATIAAVSSERGVD